MNRIKYLLVIGYWLLLIGNLFGQYYFGKNKVNYKDFNFSTLETEHLKIFFYTGGEALAEFVSKVGEEYYNKISEELNIKIEGKVPIIIYNSHNEFTQTNIQLTIIEESVGGFAELFKNRVVLPFNGSYADFKHTLIHELVHIFEFEMFFKPRLASILSLVPEFQIPLWVMEGLSEFFSETREISHDLFLSDLVINNRLVPIDKLSDDLGYLVYREGAAIFHFIEERYSRKKVFEFLHNLKLKKNVSRAFEKTFGMTDAEFSKRWEDYLKVKYYPRIVKKENFSNIATLLTDHTKDGSVYNTAPAISPSGTKIAFISDRNDYTDIYVISAIDGQILRHLIKGERSAGFESVNLFRGGISWSQDEKFLVFVSRSGGKDGIMVCEYPSGKIRKRLTFNLDAIFSPSLDKASKKVVFVGVKNGFSDIYVADLLSGRLERITYDIYEDKDPSFSLSGDTILFISDRPEAEDEWIPGNYGIFLTTLDSALSTTHELLPFRMEYCASPIMTNDGNIIFVAGDSSINIYLYSLLEDRIVKRTDFLGGVYYPTLSRDGKRLAFAYYSNYGWDIAVISEPLKKIPDVIDTKPRPIALHKGHKSEGLDYSKVKPYSLSLSLDYAVGAASYSYPGGVTGTLNLAFSDILGDHRFYLITDLYRNIENSDFLFAYLNFKARTDWGLALFQYLEYHLIPPNFLHLRRNRGIGTLVAYPLNKFFRFEAGFLPQISENELLRYSQQFGWQPFETHREKLFYLDGAGVFDNTFFIFSGPVRGTRVRLGTYRTIFSDRTFQTGYIDYRNYQKFFHRFVFATRLFGILSFLGEPELFSLVGGRDIRGYNPYGPFYEFYSNRGSKLVLMNLELRHPFIDRLKIAFPLPIDIRDIRGVTFLDAGLVFPDTGRVVIWNSQKGHFQDLKIGVGFGLRIWIAYLPLKLDFGYPLSELSGGRRRGIHFYFTIGTDF